MNKLLKIRQERANQIKAARAMLDLAEKEKRSFTEEESKQYEAMLKDIDQRQLAIEAEEKLQSFEAGLAQTNMQRSAPVPDGTVVAPNPGEFRNLDDFLTSALTIPNDPRLGEIHRSEGRVMQMGVGTAGGFAVPAQFSTEILSIAQQESVIEPRATIIPAGTPPDAAITFPLLNQQGGDSFAGITMAWIGEGDTKQVSETDLLQFTLTPHEIAGYIPITEKLLRNAPALVAMVKGLMSKALAAGQDVAYISGNGIAKPKGFLDHACTLAVTRAVASQISFLDVITMFSSAKFGGKLAWYTSQSTMPQLMQIKDGASNNIWLPSMREGIPSTLLGLPVLVSERFPLLGTAGDLTLADMSYYMIKRGSGPYIGVGTSGTDFEKNRLKIKIFTNVDGNCWLSEPITLENGDEVSPFVVLS